MQLASYITVLIICIIIERPEPIENVTVQAVGSRWALITWSVPYNGNSEIMGYVIYIINVPTNAMFIANVSSDSIRKRQAMSSLTISHNVTENILPAMLYQFIVVACNELGCGELRQPSPTILTDPERKHISAQNFTPIN